MKRQILECLAIMAALFAIVLACAYFGGPPPTIESIEQSTWDVLTRDPR